eukprot:TRINITY_DN4398_c0_g1_i3.p1 TRINITY_DN4398_c0_g1~~TRINITY_DN4398_c0_g1_i3.p1  ORF type:complete len:556 (+),score=158.53 TRINITY_DN4398_c0_g1_i3:130-1668(+)
MASGEEIIPQDAGQCSKELSSLCDQYIEALQTIKRSSSTHSPDCDVWLSVWRLIQALWSPQVVTSILPHLRSFTAQAQHTADQSFSRDHSMLADEAVDPTQMDYVEPYARKMAVSRWLEQTLEAEMKDELKSMAPSDPNTMWTLLSVNRVTEAVEKAWELGDFRLATIISQIGSDGHLREVLERQLKAWAHKGVNDLIDPPHRRIYQLLAGDLHDATELSWLRGLGLLMWYNQPAERSLADLLCLDYERHGASMSLPMPHYRARPRSQLSRAEHEHFEAARRADRAEYDVRYNLLQLYCSRQHPLHHLVRPASLSAAPLDFHMAFFLHDIVQYLNLDYPDGGLITQLHMDFALQLELLGLWHWAIYIVMTSQRYTTLEYCQEVVMDILCRHWGSSTFSTSTNSQPLAAASSSSSSSLLLEWDSVRQTHKKQLAEDEKQRLSSIEHFLRHDAGVPQAWINQAKALREGYDARRSQVLPRQRRVDVMKAEVMQQYKTKPTVTLQQAIQHMIRLF